MNRKIIIALIVFFIFVAEIFLWWIGEGELRRLNKDLPQGIIVEEIAGRQIVMNKKDDYEIKIPETWEGLERVSYSKKGNKELRLEGKGGDFAIVSRLKIAKVVNFDSWISKVLKKFKGVKFSKFVSFLGKETIKVEIVKGNNPTGTRTYNVAKIKDGKPLNEENGPVFFYYFRREDKIFEIIGNSEKDIKTIFSEGDFQ